MFEFRYPDLLIIVHSLAHVDIQHHCPELSKMILLSSVCMDHVFSLYRKFYVCNASTGVFFPFNYDV